jgi:colanic acid/amylovoran biosynthesis glycosyltransferase
VVSTFIASIPELVDNGRNGILVPEKNVSALAEAIVKLLKNPALRFQIGANGREKIEKEFNIATQIKLQLSIWSDIIAKDESI